MVSFMSLLLYPRYPLDIWMGEPQNRSGCSGEEKYLLPLSGIKPRPSARCYTGSSANIFVIKLKHGHTSTYDFQNYDPIKLTPITLTLQIFRLQLETRTPNSPVTTVLLSEFIKVLGILHFHEVYVFVYNISKCSTSSNRNS
jgi:hypothetical protein